MIPSVLGTQIRQSVEDFLQTTFPFTTPEFRGVLEDLAKRAFQGPYVSLQLPFRTGQTGRTFFPEAPLGFLPWLHQERAFARLEGEEPQPTIVATGTGSGKTESFLLPILDYCRRHAGEPGVKAILIYPLNALATDQAGRIASRIHQTASLKGVVRAGLYIGADGNHPRRKMSAEGIITDRNVMQDTPPDILLTNYKMLDFLMVRPRDARIWTRNTPDTLRFVVVDELHTFDGAQGTDLACLLRRLKARLNARKVCPIGTSATLGARAEAKKKLLDYVHKIFDTVFPDDAIIGEERLSANEFLADALITAYAIPRNLSANGPLDPARYAGLDAYIAAQYREWFGETVPTEEIAGEAWQQHLGQRLKSHAAFQNLLKITDSGAHTCEHVARRLAEITPGAPLDPSDIPLRMLESLLALVSIARNPESRPLISIRYEVWIRELRRIVSSICDTPRLAWLDDLKQEEAETHLPVLVCDDCGTAGWGGEIRGEQVMSDQKRFYKKFFAKTKNSNVYVLFPDQDGSLAGENSKDQHVLCPGCLSLSGVNAACCENCKQDEVLVRVFVPGLAPAANISTSARLRCPSCQAHHGLRILGSRAASLTSVVTSQLYTSRYNDDKKLLTFSDSVQDAAHRAGFFQARTFAFSVRSALAQFIRDQGEGKTLQKVATNFAAHHRAALGDEDFIGTYIASDLTWRQEYEHLVAEGRLPHPSYLPTLVSRRLEWEAYSALGFRSRSGRSLEKTQTCTAAPHVERLQEVAAALLGRVRNKIGGLESISETQLLQFLAGFLYRLRYTGAIFHPGLETYVANKGKSFFLTKRKEDYMPSIARRIPTFLSAVKSEAFSNPFQRQSRTWYALWSRKNFVDLFPEYVRDMLEIVLGALVKHNILETRDVAKKQVWGLRADALRVTAQVEAWRCDRCNHATWSAADAAVFWEGMRCHRIKCRGAYVRIRDASHPKRDYYRSLYLTSDVCRIVAQEHTGLLPRAHKEALEKQFKEENPRPWDTNLISCTPTLELGIDIGDLSSLILCSVPPGQANYLQRIGRAGRRDGNALAITVANTRSHDLYFFAKPTEMIQGDVTPPGTFLKAPAILQRQLAAFCMDRWVASGIDYHAVPPRLGTVLNQLKSEDNQHFPGNWLHFIDTRKTELLEDFVVLFEGEIDTEIRAHLEAFLENNEQGLRAILCRSLWQKFRERESLQNTRQRLNQQVRNIQKRPKDKHSDTEISDLKRERGSLQNFINAINKTYLYNFLTDEGLLPNYTLPEEGVTLKSIIYRKKRASEGGYQTTTGSFRRPARQAIHELAPGNTFYGAGRKVRIEQVDLALSDLETWRFCAECAYARWEGLTDEVEDQCPQCKDDTWNDSGRVHKMVRMRGVLARSSDEQSRLQDDSEDRERAFFCHATSVMCPREEPVLSWSLQDNAAPYGFEFVRRAHFIDINYGEQGEYTAMSRIAGKDVPLKGFGICTRCHKIQIKDGLSHTSYCSIRAPSKENGDAADIYLYHEFHAETIRMLLPFTTASTDDRKLHSFEAGLYLGLEQYFGGQIKHLKAITQDEPIEGTPFKRQYLFLYDTVSGGTGYLKEFMRDPAIMMQVFEHAATRLRTCPCTQDAHKDGCYRCLYAHRHARRQDAISRTIALELFEEILAPGNSFQKGVPLHQIDLNPLLESELERRFLEVLAKRVSKHDGTLDITEIHEKEGYRLALKDHTWTIEPQVVLGEADNVRIPSRADFVIRSSEPGIRPIAVFTDGYRYHETRLGEDTAQRMALHRSGNYLFWSLAWHDLEKSDAHPFYDYIPLDSTRPHSANFDKNAELLSTKHGVKRIPRRLSGEGSLEWLLEYLASPSWEAWRDLAYMHAVIHIQPRQDHPDWEGLLYKRSPYFVAEAFPVGKDDLAGCFEPVQVPGNPPEVATMVRTSMQGLRAMDPGAMHGIVHLDDTQETRKNKGYERAWRGFLRAMNLFQFLPHIFFTTSSGLQEGRYDSLAGDVEPEDYSWEEVYARASEECRALVKALQESGITAPIVDYTLKNHRDPSRTYAEFAWETEQVAVLRSDQWDQRRPFIDAGWTVFLPRAHAAQKIIQALRTHR